MTRGEVWQNEPGAEAKLDHYVTLIGSDKWAQRLIRAANKAIGRNLRPVEAGHDNGLGYR